MIQSKYLCVILQVKCKKNINSPFFFTWFLILDKTQAGGQDGNLVLRCHRNPAVPPPTKYTPLCIDDQRLSTEGKILLKHCNISKTKGGGGMSINPPPLYQGEGLCVCLKVKAVAQWTPSGGQWLSKILWYFANVRVLTCPKQWS